MTYKPDFEHLGLGPGARDLDELDDWAVLWLPDQDLWKVRFLPSGQTVEITAYDLKRAQSSPLTPESSPVLWKNALIRAARAAMAKSQ